MCVADCLFGSLLDNLDEVGSESRVVEALDCRYFSVDPEQDLIRLSVDSVTYDRRSDVVGLTEHLLAESIAGRAEGLLPAAVVGRPEAGPATGTSLGDHPHRDRARQLHL